jgi:hypothetical protein
LLNACKRRQSLSKLKYLWLAGNPVDATPNYRQTVLKNLPQLQKLDDIRASRSVTLTPFHTFAAVTPDEVLAAATIGTDVCAL